MVSLLGSVTSSLASGLFTSLGQLVLLVGGKVLLFLLLRHLHPAFEGIFGDARDLGPYLQIEVFDDILRDGSGYRYQNLQHNLLDLNGPPPPTHPVWKVS